MAMSPYGVGVDNTKPRPQHWVRQKLHLGDAGIEFMLRLR